MGLTLLKIQLSEEPFHIAWAIALLCSIAAYLIAGRGKWNSVGWIAFMASGLAPVVGYELTHIYLREVRSGGRGVAADWHSLLIIFSPLLIATVALLRYFKNRGIDYVRPSRAVSQLRIVYCIGFWLNILLCYLMFVLVELTPGGSPSLVPHEYWGIIDDMLGYRTYLIAAVFAFGLACWTIYARYLLKELESQASPLPKLEMD